MRSIRRRAGWSTVAKKSGSPTATRSTGICSRANQTRTAAGMRSSVRMLWNSSATISIVARSTGVSAACFSACLRWLQLFEQLRRHCRRARTRLGVRSMRRCNALLRLADRLGQRRRHAAAMADMRGVGKRRQLALDQAVQARRAPPSAFSPPRASAVPRRQPPRCRSASSSASALVHQAGVAAVFAAAARAPDQRAQVDSGSTRC